MYTYDPVKKMPQNIGFVGFIFNKIGLTCCLKLTILCLSGHAVTLEHILAFFCEYLRQYKPLEP